MIQNRIRITFTKVYGKEAPYLQILSGQGSFPFPLLRPRHTSPAVGFPLNKCLRHAVRACPSPAGSRSSLHFCVIVVIPTLAFVD